MTRCHLEELKIIIQEICDETAHTIKTKHNFLAAELKEKNIFFLKQ